MTVNGYFKLKNPDDAAKKIYATYDKDPLITGYVKNEQLVSTFWKNEPRKNIDVSKSLQNAASKKIDIFALYGKRDGLYSNDQLSNLKRIIGKADLKHLDNCSHTPFIDQQEQFLSSIQNWIRR